MRDSTGFDSEFCTARYCRRHLDPGAGIQMLVVGPDGESVEHRHCVQHHAEYMNRESVTETVKETANV